MIKKKQFAIQQEDEEDFEAFLNKLNQKRQHDIGAFIDNGVFKEQKTSPEASNKSESPVKQPSQPPKEIHENRMLTEVTEIDASTQHDASQSKMSKMASI